MRGRLFGRRQRGRQWRGGDPFTANMQAANPHAAADAPDQSDAANADEIEDVRDRFASIRSRLLGMGRDAARRVDDVSGRLDGDAPRGRRTP